VSIQLFAGFSEYKY